MIADLVTLVDDPSHEIGIRLAVFADDEKRCGNIFSFENVENRGRPAWIRTIVKR